MFIYAKEDLCWPSSDSVRYMMNRLKTKKWKYEAEEICCEKASHILVPLSASKAKMFKIERKYPKECLKSRMDAFNKTIEWIKAL
ncbi:acyl-CoA thioester hydrolase/BAAT C-terminal domain-containing protein [Clostridium hydrogenum]|uniref:acyl-CoA thioester hydrolase/BAAT C-terminal domain-containing protein n=1 Tax=Clostridium hydrogenum TaxID=2855764 RepID=UPI001F3BD0D2|nr:acyl-CoA thioester hydrolase/BAAT C-terminal domain-containing protein [Clostridium hydrogenum]